MSFFTLLVSSKIAVSALAIGTLAAGGTAAAAFTGTLPTPLQESAHTLIGAPAPATPDTDAAKPSPTATPGGPDADGPSAHGLCNAFMHGGLNSTSTAFKSLATAAKGAANIATYCSTVVSHDKSAKHQPSEVKTETETETKPETETDAHTAAPEQADKADTDKSHKPSTTGRP